MVSVYTINGEVTLDITPFTSQLTKLNGELNKLSKGFKFDRNAIGSMESDFKYLEMMMKEVATQASQINKAFSNIEGIRVLIENLNEVKAFLREMGYEIGNNKTKLTSVNNELRKSVGFSKEVGTYFANEDKILRMSLRTLKEQDNQLKAKLAKSKEETQLAREIAMINKQDMAILEGKATSIKNIVRMEGEELRLYTEINALIKQGTAESLKQAETQMKEINTKSDLFKLLQEQLNLEKEVLAVQEEQDAVLKKQVADKEKSMAAQGNLLDKPGYLGRRIGSMAITMLGYQEIMDVWEKTTANVNAKTQFGTYSKLLKEDTRYLNQTKQSTADVTKGINALNVALHDTYKNGKSLQQMYSKVDMQMVGANALDTAFKYGVQAKDLDELTEVMAIYSSEFVRQGRSQEDSILAVNDALDGEFRRLKEVNIGKEELEAHGYEEGNTLSLIRAMREIAQERGYDVTAQKITTLSEAINQAELELAFLLSDLFELVEPSLIIALGYVVQAFQALGGAVKEVKKYLKGLPQPVKDVLKQFGAGLMIGIVGVWVGSKVLGAIKNISLFGNAWGKLQEKLGRTKGMDKASESLEDFTNSTSGGTKDSKKGGFKEGFKAEFSKLGKNLGIMARAFIEVAVVIAMAWALMKEALFLISDLGKDWEAHKAEFNTGIEFIREYGIWILAASAVIFVALNYLDKIPMANMDAKAMGKSFGKIALGLAVSMGLIAEAIALLNLPLLAIASIGYVTEWTQQQINDGMATIHMFADAINYIASDDTMGWFVVGFVAISAILGLTADVVAVPLAAGIAATLLLVAEAVAMLIVPLGAIALLGASASALGEENINQGAETIKMIGRVLKVLAEAMVDLFVVDIATLGIMLVDKANQFITGKTGLQALVDEIIPDLVEFVQKFNGLEMGAPVDQAKVAMVTQMATDIPPLFAAIQKVNAALGTSDAIGNILGGLGGSISGAIGMGLKGKLDQLYNDIRDVMDFATKLGGLGTGGNANTTAIQQTANAITQLKTKLNQFVATISGAAARVQTASNQLGNALTNGFKSGAAGFSVAVVSVMAKGVSEIQSRYATFNSAGKALAEKLSSGFSNNSGKIKTAIHKEMKYALDELDNYRDDFYSKGQALGAEMTRGFQDGADIHSPGLIARTTARELRYTMDALNVGERMLYQGGVALGQALTNGYNSAGNIRTDIGMLAQKGVTNEQLQANAKNVQANTNAKGQSPQLTQNNFNIDMSGATIIGVQDLDAKIRQAVEKAIVSINSPNGAIGY